MAKKMDYHQAALDIVRLVGGPKNVQSLEGVFKQRVDKSRKQQ